MPLPWRPSLYRIDSLQSPPPDAHTLASLVTAAPQIDPYNANTWIKRAAYYLRLNFPELAAGDAYKADLLFERDYNDPEDGDTNDKRANIYNILSQALYDCHCHWELKGLREASLYASSSKCGADKFANINDLCKRKQEAAVQLGGTPWEIKDRIRDGGILTVDYPWTHERHLKRSRELIYAINKELIRSEEQPNCYLARSTLSAHDDVLGVFAAQDFRLGDSILFDRTAIGACSNVESAACDNCYDRLSGPPTLTSCCGVVYCSAECRDLAVDTYHKPLCGKDFSWLQEPAKGLTSIASPLRPLLMLRILAMCVQAGPDKHPLDHPLVARLQPLANRSHLDVFTFDNSIVTPIKILEQLGIPIFSNQNFDTMVLHTIWTRLANNKAGSPDPRRGFMDLIPPHLPLFNHSCEPNVSWKRIDCSTRIWFLARSDIKRGEELFSSYLDVDGLSLATRTEILSPWFEGPCLCWKCTRERAIS